MAARRRPIGWAVAAGAALLGWGTMGAAQLDAQLPAGEIPAVGTGVTHVRKIEPRFGPAGTTIRIEADGLPINTSVYVALASIHAGYEVGATTQTDAEGRLHAALTVPERHRDHWDHTEMVVVLAEEGSRPMALSDPFHITNAQGFVQRSGVIRMVGQDCPVLDGWDGVTYALVGGQGPNMAASAGHQLTVEGALVDATCGLQNAIEVRRSALPPHAH